jgi:hypothetical protein
MDVFRFRKLTIVSLFVAAGYAVTIFFKGTAFVLTHVVPVLQIVDVCAAFVSVPLLGLAGFRKARPVAAHGFLLLAYLFGVSNWMYACVVLCASPPMEPISYFWGVLTTFFASLALPGRFNSDDKPGGFLAFIAAFPVCAIISAILQGAPFASFIVGLGLTFAFIALSILLGIGGRKAPANPASGAAAAIPSDKPAKKVVPCPGCSTKLSLPAGKTGQVKCPRCGRMFKAAT